jgi:hypothetical protein
VPPSRFLTRVLAPTAAVAAGVAVLLGYAPEHGGMLSPIDVQRTDNPSGESPWLGQSVEVEGVVTGVSPHATFYYVADPAGGPWSGLKVQGSSAGRTVGERVLVRGVVIEESGETRLEQSSVQGGTRGRLPEPQTITVTDLSAHGERWEGVLVRIEDVTVTSRTSRFGEFSFRDAGGSGGEVDDEFFHPYIADIGDRFEAIGGIVAWGFGDYHVEPRSGADLVGFRSVRGHDGQIVVSVHDTRGRFLPSRVTLFAPNGSALHLGPDDRAEGSTDETYVIRDPQTVPVPAGTYDVVISRGIEYGFHQERVTVPSGGEATVRAVLERELDSRGWLSGDFHLHSAPSSDTPMPVPGRIMSLAGEGVEWAIATDHNAITDYAPVIGELGLTEWITSSVGDEITTHSPGFGHFNAWPLELGGVPPRSEGTTPAALFAAARADLGVEVVQVNHPIVESWGNQYFQVYGVSPFTGDPSDPAFSFDYDALEIFNGQFVAEGLNNLEIWMRQLNNGHRITATGNSDSHHLVYSEPGYPRNYVRSSTDRPAEASEDELVAAVLAGRSFVTYGPLIDLRVNGGSVGDLVGAPDGTVQLWARVQCASWMDVNEARVYANGKQVATLPIARSEPGPMEVTLAWEDAPQVDTWYLLYVDGPGTLAPVRRGGGFRPLAFTNPVWVDVDASGGFDPPGNVADEVTVAELDAVDASGIPLRIGDWVSVTGCAVTDTRFGDPTSGIFYVEDGTGGVQVRETVGTVTEVRRGDRVWAGGYVAQTVGETVLTECEIQVLGPGGGCGGPQTATTGAVAQGTGIEPLEGRVVAIAGANVVGGSWPTGGAEGVVTVDDGSGPVTLLVPRGVSVPPEAGGLQDFPFTALVTQRDFSPPFLSGYRLTLRDGQDLLGRGPGATDARLAGAAGLSFGTPRPNPFRGEIRVPLSGRPGGAVPRVEVLDVTGRRVRSLVPESAGAGRIVWDGRDSGGRSVAAGVYYLRLRGTADARTVRVVKLQ